MTLDELLRIGPKLLRSPTARILKSAPGRGKSQSLFQLVKTMSELDGEQWGFARVFAPTTNPMDLLGVISIAKHTFKSGETLNVSEYAVPPWYRCYDDNGREGLGELITSYKKGLVVIEEHGQGEGETKRCLANLFCEHQLGPWKLPPDWRVIATSNRANDRSGVTKDYDHDINRKNVINISDDLRSLLNWQWRNNRHPDVISFSDQNSGTVFGEQPEKQGPFCTPRSLAMAEDDLCAMSDDGFTLPVDATATELVAGTVGDGAAAQLMSHLRLAIDLPSIEEIVKNPSGTKVPTKADAHMLVAFRLAALVKKETAEPIIEYMQRLPKEFAVPFAKTAVHREKSLMTTKAFHNWCVKNASLMVVLQDAK
jgi:hypothetical protein